jgi:PPOX class probable F420-dependent enzyme
MRSSAGLARQRFSAARVARLASVSAAGEPHLVPVTFAMVSPAAESDGSGIELIVFAVDHKPKSTTALRRLDNIAANPRVAFLVDFYDDDWDQLWWVRADATAAVLHGRLRHGAINALEAKYRQYREIPPDGVVVGSSIVNWSSWQAGSNTD